MRDGIVLRHKHVGGQSQRRPVETGLRQQCSSQQESEKNLHCALARKGDTLSSTQTSSRGLSPDITMCEPSGLRKQLDPWHEGGATERTPGSFPLLGVIRASCGFC